MIQINHIWVVPKNFVFEIKVGLLFAWLTTSKITSSDNFSTHFYTATRSSHQELSKHFTLLS